MAVIKGFELFFLRKGTIKYIAIIPGDLSNDLKIDYENEKLIIL